MSGNSNHDEEKQSLKESEKQSQQEQERGSQQEGSQHGEDGNGSDGEPAKKKKIDKNDPDYKHPIIGLVIFTILTFISLLFLTIATPIEWFELDDTYSDKVVPFRDPSKKICVTAWGLKNGCREKKYIYRDFTKSFCYRVRTDFKVIEAFCIMTISFTAFALLCGILSICHIVGKGTAAALGSFAAVMGIMVWGIPAGMYYQMPCCETTDWHTDDQLTTCFFQSELNPAINVENVPGFKDMGKYGAAFGLAVAAWAVQFIGCIFAYLPF